MYAYKFKKLGWKEKYKSGLTIDITTKSVCLTMPFSINLISLMSASVAFSHPLSPSFNYPSVLGADNNNLICYMQTANGLTLDLISLCGKPMPGKTLSKLTENEQTFVDSYKKSISADPETQALLLLPRIEREPQSAVQQAQNVCRALKGEISFNDVRRAQSEMAAKSGDANSQQTVSAEAAIINSLAPKFFCPEFAY